MTFNSAQHPRIPDGTFTQKAQSAPETALGLDAPAHVQRISDSAGLGGVMPAVLTVLRDRETVSDAQLRALTAKDIAQMYEGHIEPVISRLEASLSGPIGLAPSTGASTESHLRSISEGAGLGGVMPEIFSVIRDREEVAERNYQGLTVDDVTTIYENRIGPAIDGLENYLLCGDR